jgi:HEAT repeat protein
MKSAQTRLKGLELLHQDMLFIALKEDECDIVRHEAAFIIGKIFEEGKMHSGSAALVALLGATRDPSILVRHEVALALGKFDCHEAFGALIHLASDCSPEVQRSARFALTEQRERKSNR